MKEVIKYLKCRLGQIDDHIKYFKQRIKEEKESKIVDFSERLIKEENTAKELREAIKKLEAGE